MLHAVELKAAEGLRAAALQNAKRCTEARGGTQVLECASPLCSLPRILRGFGVDDQAASPVLSPQPTPTACGRARLTSQVQLLAPRLKGQVIDDLESRPFR
jgi:hypothetical protein